MTTSLENQLLLPTHQGVCVCSGMGGGGCGGVASRIWGRLDVHENVKFYKMCVSN